MCCLFISYRSLSRASLREIHPSTRSYREKASLLVPLLGYFVARPTFPPCLKVLCASRPDNELAKSLTQHSNTSRETHVQIRRLRKADSVAEVKAFVASWLEGLGRGQTAPAVDKVAECITALQKKADGNFLYAEAVVTALQSGVLGWNDVTQEGCNALPDSLVTLYQCFFERRFETAEERAFAVPILSIMTAADGVVVESELPLLLRLANAPQELHQLAKTKAKLESFLRRKESAGHRSKLVQGGAQEQLLAFHHGLVADSLTAAQQEFGLDLMGAHRSLAAVCSHFGLCVVFRD